MLTKSESEEQSRDKLLNALFGALSNADYRNINDLFTAFDAYSLSTPAVFEDTGTLDDNLRARFSQAEQLLHFSSLKRQSPLDYVSAQIVPTVIVDLTGHIISANTLFSGAFKGVISNAESDKPFSFARHSLSAMLRKNTPQKDSLIELQIADQTAFFLAERVELWTEKAHLPDVYISLKQLSPIVTDSVTALLAEKFSLTDAEVRIVSDLVEHTNIEAIAEKRSRSIRTIRTQLSHIYQKVGVTTQIELFALVSTLALLVRAPEWRNERGDQAGLELYHIDVSGGRLSYHAFGPRNGMPVLLLNNSFRPSLTTKLRGAFSNARCRVIIPIKPGSAETTPVSKSASPSEIATSYVALLDYLKIKKCSVLGLHSAGINALALARLAPDRINKIVLSDTGVPYQNRADIMARPASTRRTMLPARYAPMILHAPHKIVSSVFHKSLEGEQRIVEYFFTDSPADARLCQTDKKFYELTRDTIRYSFEDVDRLVSDVANWASDWSDLLISATKSHEIIFVYGTENTMFDIEKIASFCETHDADLIRIPGEGQLQIFRQPRGVLAALTGKPFDEI